MNLCVHIIGWYLYRIFVHSPCIPCWCYITNSELFCLSTFFIPGCEFEYVINIHISETLYKLYTRRLSHPSRCGSCLDIVVSCGLLMVCYCRECGSEVFYSIVCTVWGTTQERHIYFYHHNFQVEPVKDGAEGFLKCLYELPMR